VLSGEAPRVQADEAAAPSVFPATFQATVSRETPLGKYIFLKSTLYSAF
jgi:hypothetical protein